MSNFWRSARCRTSTNCLFHGNAPSWNAFAQHPNLDDFWTKEMCGVLPYMQPVKVPTLLVAGYFDAEDFYGPLELYKKFETRGSEAPGPPGDGTLVPRQLEQKPRRAFDRQNRLRPGHLAVVSRSRPGTLVRALVEGQGVARFAPGAGFQNGRESMGTLRLLAASAGA